MPMNPWWDTAIENIRKRAEARRKDNLRAWRTLLKDYKKNLPKEYSKKLAEFKELFPGESETE